MPKLGPTYLTFSVEMAVNHSVEVAVLYSHLMKLLTFKHMSKDTSPQRVWIETIKDGLSDDLPYIPEKKLKKSLKNIIDEHLLDEYFK